MIPDVTHQISLFDQSYEPTVSQTLRPYQIEAVERIMAQHERIRSTLLVMATGCGKTQVFSEVIARTKGRCLVLAHRAELIDQAAQRIRAHTGRAVSIDKAAEIGSRHADVVVASVQTLAVNAQEMKRDPLGRIVVDAKPSTVHPRLARWPADHFALVVADEAHHYIAESFRRPLDYFAGAKILGVTATPDRGDEAALGAVFDEVAFIYDIATAINDGWLCRIVSNMIMCADLNLADVRITAGDLNQGDLDAIMSAEAVLHQVVGPTLEQSGNRRTLVFTTTVANSNRMTEIFNRHRPGCARSVDGETNSDLRRITIADHRAGRFQYLVNVGVFTEGYDDPMISCVAVGRPTKSRALYSQMIGRGTRIAPDKSDLLILDFTGNAGRHKLVSAVDVLGGQYPDDVVTDARYKIARKPSLDIAETLAISQADLIKKRQAEAVRRSDVKARVKYKVLYVDPFKIFGVENPTNGYTARFGDAVPSDGQLKLLAKFKININKGITKRGASRLIGEAISRSKKELCTFGQARALQKYGYQTKNMRFQEASRLLDMLAKNRWHPLSPAQREVALGKDDAGL